MRKKTKSKLTLRTDTLKPLVLDQLRGVVGGINYASYTDCNRYTMCSISDICNSEANSACGC